MGYMGFGMRKEVYTRKPKKVFDTYKREFGPGSSLDEGYIPPKDYESPLEEYDRRKGWYKPADNLHKVMGLIFAFALMFMIIFILFVVAYATNPY